MKRLIAVELHERDGKATCRGCEIGEVRDDDIRTWCIRLQWLIKDNKPPASCPIRNSPQDAAVRKALELVRLVIETYGKADNLPRIKAVEYELRKAVEL